MTENIPTEKIELEDFMHRFWLLDVSKFELPSWLNKDEVKIEGEYLILAGENGIILTENDCCHETVMYDDTILGRIVFGIPIQKRPTENSDGSKNVYPFALGEILLVAEQLCKCITHEFDDPKNDLPEWIHYFGIKGRIISNYNQLIRNCEKIGFHYNFSEVKKQ